MTQRSEEKDTGTIFGDSYPHILRSAKKTVELSYKKATLTIEEYWELAGDAAMSVVTIARLSGSGGDIIAARVAEKLGYACVDSALLATIAAREGVSVDDVIQYDEKAEPATIEWLKSIITPRINKIIGQEQGHVGPEGYFASLKEVVLGLADQGDIVIVGRGSQFILGDAADAFHVRIIAEPEARAERLGRYYAISREEALDRIKRSDSMRKSFINRYFRADWDDQFAYDLIINTTRIAVEEAVETIVAGVKSFSAAHDYIPGVRDRRKRERRLGDRRKAERRDAIIWTHRDMDAALLKEGRPLRAFSKPDRRMVERRAGDRRKNDGAEDSGPV